MNLFPKFLNVVVVRKTAIFQPTKVLHIWEARFIMKILQITVFLYLIIFLTTRVATAIHEVLGHGLASVLMGGVLTGVSINLFTTGSASYELVGSGLLPRVFTELAGIAVNLVTGVGCLIVLAKMRLKWEVRIVLCVFAMASIGSQLIYLVMGTYYGQGDPLVFGELFGTLKWLVWLLFLILMAPATYILTDSFLRLQEEMFPSKSLEARGRILFSTLIAASVIYGVCFYAEDRSTGFLGGMTASERSITEKARKAVEGQPLTEKERIEQIEAIKNQLRPFPIIAPVFLVVLVSGLVALLKTKHRPPSSAPHHFRIWYLWGSLLLSILVGGIIVTA